jgi:DNA polymerase-4
MTQETDTSERVILHLDLDAFYASVEQRDRPELRGRPVIVGGSRSRGVVCACSYEARRFGVRSAMPMHRAMRLCPQATVLPVRMARYRELSRQVFDIFARYTDQIEPLSVDEAFLDVTGSRRLFGGGRQIAERIRSEVRSELGLVISAGVAHNKFLAKLASEEAKPDGLYMVPACVDDFLLTLPLERLWGVGPVMRRELARVGLHTVADLHRLSRAQLERLGGQAGAQLYDLARGRDDRPVEAHREIKSIGHEDTFERDLCRPEDLQLALLDLAERVAARLRRRGLTGGTVTLKVKYADFAAVTRSRSVSGGLDHAGDIFQVAEDLLARTEAGRRPVRLLGISLGQLRPRGAGQQCLFGTQRRQRLADLDRAVDELHSRFGKQGVCRASLMAHRRDFSDPE